MNKVVSMDSPSAQRNKAPIWDVLSKNVLSILPSPIDKISVLEIACGCGVHTEFFVSKMIEENKQQRVKISWLPTDPDESSRDATEIRCCGGDNNSIMKESILAPVSLTLDENGPIEKDNIPMADDTIQLMLCINMIHISPWSATIGLMNLAKQKLDEGGILYCYGPFKVNGIAVESNLRFDESLKSRDNSQGVRNLEDVMQVANECGLELVKSIEMPANNLSLIFRKK